LVVHQFFPELKAMLQYSADLLGVVYLGWHLLQRRRKVLVAFLRDELSSGQFNDDVIRAQLETLDKRSPRLPSAIYNLLDTRVPTFSEAEMDRFKSTITTEQWKRGMQIKGAWQKELLRSERSRNDTCE